MKFGKEIREKTLKEWRFYAVDYKALKKVIADDEAFFSVLDEAQDTLSKFYHDKESWAVQYMKTLEDRVAELRAVPIESPTCLSESSSSDTSLTSSDDDDSDYDEPVKLVTPSSLKEEYRRMGASKHFKAFIYAKKSLATFGRELDLLLEFLSLNQTAFGKILKKFDKRRETDVRESKMEEILERCSFLDGSVFRDLRDEVNTLVDEVHALKPQLPEGWENRKVYTIGCFDLFHRGHQNVLLSLREFGYYIVAGIHDDESYYKLKNKYTIDNLETRMKNVKPYVDQIYVIPSTDPLLYIQSMVSQQDIDMGTCCYARGDDMLNFPGREWVESVMPVHFVPRTEACSSTLIRTIYHADTEEIRQKAAFAKTRYDGKPIDENGNVLKFTKA